MERDVLTADRLMPGRAGEIMELFKRLNVEKGMTILQVTHSDETATYGTRTVVIDSGKIVDSGKP